MYQQWQNDPSMDSVINLIEERESPEIHKQNYNPRNSESSNWGIMSLRDVDAPTRPAYQESSTSRGRGETESSRRRPESPPAARRDEARRNVAPLRWRTGRELAPVGRFGLEIASRLTQQMRVERCSISSEDDRRSPRSKRRQDTPEKRIERKRRSSRSGSEGRKRSRRSRSHSRSRRGRSGSRDKKRHRSRSRERKRDRSTERKRDRSTERKRDRSTERKRDRSTDRKRDRSTERNRNIKSPSRERQVLLTATEPKQTAPPASVNDATTEILSKFINIIKDVKEKEPQNQKVPFPYKDVLPEFDPVDKANAIVTWITRVDDIAKLFGWEEKEILQYAMPKLAGLAKVWYLGRKDFVHSWVEWKKKLVDQFPCPDFWQMLEELKQRNCGGDETLEDYFHDKMVLVKRCGIRGRQAVECVLQGVAEEAVRLFAAAAQFDEPEELLRYLQTAEAIRKKIARLVTPAIPTVVTPAIPTVVTPAIPTVVTPAIPTVVTPAIPTVVTPAIPTVETPAIPTVVTPAKPTPTTAPKNAGKHCTYCDKPGHLQLTCQARIAAEKREAKKSIQCTVETPAIPTVVTPAKPTPTTAPKNAGKHCTYCDKPGHLQLTCQARIAAEKREAKKSIQCTNCMKYGHGAAVCWFKTGSNIVNNNPVTPKQMACDVCGKPGHNASVCRLNKQQTQPQQPVVIEKKPKVCRFCGVVGHIKPKCSKFKAQQRALREEQESAPDTTGSNVAVPGPSVPRVGDIKIEEPPPPGVEDH